MNSKESTYRSLVIRKVQQLAKEHGGLAKIPREIQKQLGLEVIAKRKGTSISVTIPPGDLSSKIDQLQADLPAAKAFGSSKPAPDPFGKYTPVASQTNPTMDDFWIAQGWYKQDRIGIKLTYASWKDDEKVRIDAVRFLVEKVLKKDPRDITLREFASNRLTGLIDKYFNGSPYKAFTEAGYKFHAWEMAKTPNNFYDSKENRVAATKWLVDKLGKDPRGLTTEDFQSNRLAGLLADLYSGSPYTAVLEAGYAYSQEESLQHAQAGNFKPDKFYPWEMSVTPNHFYDSKENRVAATKWIVWKTGKDPRDLTMEDFKDNCLWGLMDYYGNSPYAAFIEAGYKIQPWEMMCTPNHFYDSKKTRIAAVKWLIAKLKKDPRDLTRSDFRPNRLGGLFSGIHYQGSPYKILLELDYVYSTQESMEHAKTGNFQTDKFYPWEMLWAPISFYESKEHRVAATNWLVWKLGKDPRDIIKTEFSSNRLTGLIDEYYNASPYAAFTEAGYQFHPWEMAKTPNNFYNSKENRVAATKWLVDKLGKDPRDIIGEDFNSNRLGGLIGYYQNSPYAALLEAGLVTQADERYMRSYGRYRFTEVRDP